MLITSRDNEKIKNIVRLSSSASARARTGLFIADGMRLCRDAAENGCEIKELYCTNDFISAHGDCARVLSAAAGVFYEVSDAVMKKMSDTVSPQGCLCLCAVPDEGDKAFKSTRKYIILDGISDPGNLGAVSRSAEAFGVDALIVGGGCDVYSPKALRASMGALLRLPVMRTPAAEAVKRLNELNAATYAAVVDGYDCEISDCDFSGGCACVIGNEAAGVSDGVRALCSHCFTVPMSGRAESLNASCAAAVIIWEMMK